MDENLTITPYTDFSVAKRKVEKLSEGDVKAPQLIDSMNQLTQSMQGMLELFRTAAEEMKLEEKEEHALSAQLTPILSKLDEIIDQNRVIADGMVALADLIKERMPRQDKSEPVPPLSMPPTQQPSFSPQQPMFSQPQMPPVSRQPMRPFGDPYASPSHDPFDIPPPPEMPKKKGLFRK